MNERRYYPGLLEQVKPLAMKMSGSHSGKLTLRTLSSLLLHLNPLCRRIHKFTKMRQAPRNPNVK